MIWSKEIFRPSLIFLKAICDESNRKIIEQFDLHSKAILKAFEKTNG